MKYFTTIFSASERQDSNLRLRAPKARTLTKLSYFPMMKYKEQDTCSNNFSNPLSSIARRCGTKEDVGFEPTCRFTDLTVFKTVPL